MLPWQATLALYEGKTKAANEYIENFTFVCKERSESEVDIAMQLGDIYRNAELFDEAEDYFRESFTLESQNILMMNDLAYFFDLPYFLIDSERNVNEGLQLAEKQLEMYPDNYNYLHTKGWGLYKQGKYEESLEYLEKSWELKPIYNHEVFLHLEAAREAVAGK